MLSINRKKWGFLRIQEVFFGLAGDAKSRDADVTIYIQSPEPSPTARSFVTSHIDLNQAADQLFGEVGKNNRYKINRAEKRDGVRGAWSERPTTDNVREFVGYYNAFAKSKGVGQCNPKKLASLRHSESLLLSSVYDGSGDVLARHAYVLDDQRVRLLYSASHFRLMSNNDKRALAARANRWLHWCDILKAKEMGRRIYDFGGLGEREETQHIDDFKLSFGGRRVVEYNDIRARTVLGLGALAWMRRKLGR